MAKLCKTALDLSIIQEKKSKQPEEGAGSGDLAAHQEVRQGEETG